MWSTKPKATAFWWQSQKRDKFPYNMIFHANCPISMCIVSRSAHFFKESLRSVFTSGFHSQYLVTWVLLLLARLASSSLLVANASRPLTPSSKLAWADDRSPGAMVLRVQTIRLTTSCLSTGCWALGDPLSIFSGWLVRFCCIFEVVAVTTADIVGSCGKWKCIHRQCWSVLLLLW